jgi:quercetin dioxygenase-like cupin family protein
MRLTACATIVALLIAASASIPAQAPLPQAPEVHKLATTLRGSGCSAAGIETGDPRKGPSIIVEKFAPGCALPWHWHTPNEHVMMVSGTFRFEIQGEKSVPVNAGDFVFIPSHHTSQTTCLGPDPCINSLYTDAPADMHFVDETGAEISSDQALKNYAKTHPKQ